MPDNKNISPLELEQSFPVTAERLYKAWTDEQELKQWWKPMDTSIQSVTSQLQEGGKIMYEFERAKFKVSGNYEVVKENAELKYSWNWDFDDEALNNEQFTLHIHFIDDQGNSILRVKQEGFHNEEEREAHEEGWKTGFEQLRKHFAAQ